MDFLEALEDQLNLDIMLEKDLQDLLHLLLMNMLLTIALQEFVIRKKMYVFEKTVHYLKKCTLFEKIYVI